MTTYDVAERYFTLSQRGQFDRIQDELYSKDIESIEPEQGPWPSVKGIEAVKEKGRAWNDSVEAYYGGYTSEPKVAGEYFTCNMGMDVEIKGRGRLTMDEICVFKVLHGKIVSEQFFF